MTQALFQCLLCAGLAVATATPSFAVPYKKTVLVTGDSRVAPGTSVHGLNGLNFGNDGKLYVGSVTSGGIYRMEVSRGALEQVVAAPDGEADDVAMVPGKGPYAGALVWTALISGELRARKPNGPVEMLLKETPSINPVHVTADGRVLTGQTSPFDTILEIDLAGKKSPRTIATKLGGINAFTDDLNGGLYVPLMEKGAIGRVDLATGEMRIIADGLGQPAAVKRDSHGGLATIDWATGKVIYVNPETGETKRLATVTPPLDNLTIGPDDTIYVSRPTDNAIIAVNPNTGAQTPLLKGTFSAPGGLALTRDKGREIVVVADLFGYRFVDALTGASDLPPYDPAGRNSSAVAINANTIVIANVRRASLTIAERTSGRVTQSFSGFKSPMAVALSAGGEILMTDYGSGEILKIMPSTTPDRVAVARDLNGPVGLAFEASGHVLVSEADSGVISRIDPGSGLKKIVTQGLAQPEGLGLMPDGRIAVVEVGKRQLTLIDPTTGAQEVIAADLPVGAFVTRAPGPVYLPTGLAVDETGVIYVTGDIDNTLLKFTAP